MKSEIYEFENGHVILFVLDVEGNPVAAYGGWEPFGSLRDAIAGLEEDPDSRRNWEEYGRNLYMPSTVEVDLEGNYSTVELTLQEMYESAETSAKLISWTSANGWEFDRAKMSFGGLVAFGLELDDEAAEADDTEKIREGLALSWLDGNGDLWVATFRKPPEAPVPPDWVPWDVDDAEEFLQAKRLVRKEKEFFSSGNYWEIWATRITQTPYGFAGGGKTEHKDVKVLVFAETMQDVFRWQGHATAGVLHGFYPDNLSLKVLGEVAMWRFPKRPAI